MKMYATSPPDWEALRSQFDGSNMLSLLETFPSQVKEAIAIGESFELKMGLPDIQNLIFAGMGGSAMAGDLLQLIGRHQAPIPISVIRNYFLPEFISDKTLFMAFSFSGNTEETLSAFEHAGTKGAIRLAISSGGKLEALCRKSHTPFIRIPGGRPPRTALGYLLIPILIVLSKLNILQSVEKDLADLASFCETFIDRLKMKTGTDENPAKSLALKLANRLPIIYSSTEMSAAGLRWKSQLSENAKVLAFQNVIPEMNHNEIVGWEGVKNLSLEDRLQVIFLRDSNETPRIQSRMEITESIISQHVNVPPAKIFSTGKTLLNRIFSLILTGDFASYYLALINGVDPTPIKTIDILKSSLTKSFG